MAQVRGLLPLLLAGGLHIWLCLTSFYFPTCRGDIPQGGMKIKDALKEVLRNALINDGLARGLREAVKTLDK